MSENKPKAEGELWKRNEDRNEGKYPSPGSVRGQFAAGVQTPLSRSVLAVETRDSLGLHHEKRATVPAADAP
jgi:hypothetical protein